MTCFDIESRGQSRPSDSLTPIRRKHKAEKLKARLKFQQRTCGIIDFTFRSVHKSKASSQVINKSPCIWNGAPLQDGKSKETVLDQTLELFWTMRENKHRSEVLPWMITPAEFKDGDTCVETRTIECIQLFRKISRVTQVYEQDQVGCLKPNQLSLSNINWLTTSSNQSLSQSINASQSNCWPCSLPQTAIFNFQSLLLVILLFICTATYIHSLIPSLLDRNKDGPFSIFWKSARIGERLSPYVSISCCIMAVSFRTLYYPINGQVLSGWHSRLPGLLLDWRCMSICLQH